MTIKQTKVERVEQAADTLSEVSNGLITERQAQCVLFAHGDGDDGASFIDEDYTHKEIGEALGIDEGTVSTHVSRGMDNIMGAKMLVETIEDDPWWF